MVFSTEQSTSLFNLILRGARELERHLFKLIRGKMTADGDGCRRAEAGGRAGRHARERARGAPSPSLWGKPRATELGRRSRRFCVATPHHERVSERRAHETSAVNAISASGILGESCKSRAMLTRHCGALSLRQLRLMWIAKESCL